MASVQRATAADITSRSNGLRSTNNEHNTARSSHANTITMSLSAYPETASLEKISWAQAS
jgi:hypothetical protein